MSIRYASSLVIKRGGQVFLARRAPELRFFGDFWAFPGGSVSQMDREFADTVPAFDGTGPNRIALAREMLEELGLWLEDGPLGAPGRQVERDQIRRDVLKDESSFYKCMDRDALVSGTMRLRQVAHLLTPAYHPIRFDTCFFLLDLGDPAQARIGEPEIWPGELVEGLFDTPENWIRRWQKREIRVAAPVLLLLQTVKRLGWEGAWSELETLSAALGQGQIHTIFYNPAAQILPVPTRTRPPATHTNAILIGEDPAYLIDPGCVDPLEQDRLIAGVEQSLPAGLVPERRLRAILLTHHHPDHIGGAVRLSEHFGIPIRAHEETARRLQGQVEVSCEFLRPGDQLPLGVAPDGTPDWNLEVHFTPGHAPGHLCFFERRYETLIVGDLVSTISSILIGDEDGDMIQYLDSLRAMVALGPDLVCPAHGPAATGGVSVLQKQIRHRDQRERSVLEALREGEGTPAGIAGAVYGDVPPKALPLAEISVRSILKKLVAEGKVSQIDDKWSLSAP